MQDTLYYSDLDVDYHTLLKIAQRNFTLGVIRILNAENGYMVVFSDCDEGAKDIYAKSLNELING